MPEGSSGGRRAPDEEELLIRRWLRTADEMMRRPGRWGTNGKKGGERETPGRKPSGDRRDGEV